MWNHLIEAIWQVSNLIFNSLDLLKVPACKVLFLLLQKIDLLMCFVENFECLNKWVLLKSGKVEDLGINVLISDHLLKILGYDDIFHDCLDLLVNQSKWDLWISKFNLFHIVFVDDLFLLFDKLIFLGFLDKCILVLPFITGLISENLAEFFDGIIFTVVRSLLILAGITNSSISGEQNIYISINLVKYLHLVEHILTIEALFNIDLCHQ